MANVAKTIQIFLPTGDPRGIRVAEITTRIVRVLEIPRSMVSNFLQMPEAKQVGVYFLVGDASEQESQLLYIGQSGGVGDRISNHNKSKDFWNRALVAVSLTNSLTQTHGTFLEWVSIKDATIAGRYRLENGNAGIQPYTPAPLEADCYEIHETIGTLLATLGYPVFVPLTKTGALTEASETEERFFCRASGANGTGLYTEEGFVVLAGSTGRIDVIPSMKDTPLERLRNRLIEGGIAGVQNGSYTFLKNHLFGSPSTAAAVLTAKTSNGWLEWRDNNNRTLDELKRQGS